MFHERLKAKLDSQGWTPERLCVEMQNNGYPVTVGTVKSWMYGYREPGYSNLVGIINALGCKASDLIPGDGRKATA